MNKKQLIEFENNFKNSMKLEKYSREEAFQQEVWGGLIVVTKAIANLMGICTSTYPNDRGQI